MSRPREDPRHGQAVEAARARATWELPSLVLLVAGFLALLFMGPQFLAFVPAVLALWLLARFGLVPRVLHERHESVRLVGGPAVGPLTFAEIAITADASRRAAAIAILADVVARLQSAAGEPAIAPDGWHDGRALPERLDALVPDSGSAAEGLVLAWSGDVELPADAAGPAAAWITSWPGLIRRQSEHRARLALETAWEKGRTPSLRACLMGARDVLGPLLADFARAVRDRDGAEAWTIGWVRDAEREAVLRDRRRRR